MSRMFCLLLWQLVLRVSCYVATASLCTAGSNIFASVRENSPAGQFISHISIRSDPRANTVRLCLTGPNANWFYLEGRTIRLNSSASRVLDREVLGPFLIAELTCYEDDIKQSHYRILVEILNENDNKPKFLEGTIQPFIISEVAAVNSVVFTVKAVDSDGDMISYIIDQSSEDAWFFRIDLPNSGKVVLSKPLDYESRTRLQIIMWAQESNTEEKFNISTVLTINIEDVDDQYPHFLPCTPVSPGVPICMNPIYTANITRKHQDSVLEFSPGPIRARDGDRGINAPLMYTILSGDNHDRFVMDNRTGEIRLTRAVDERQPGANFTLIVMVCQVEDRLKYSVATVVVRVLSENSFPPVFNTTTFKGFIIQSSSPASIVSTYGNQVLQVQVSDQDFSDQGVNPNIRFFLHPPSQLYQVTQEGVLIARTDQLRAFDRHILQVVARDEESGEEASASVDIEVLQRGQAVPHGAFTEQQLFGDVDSRLAGGIAALILLTFLSAFLFLLLRFVRRRRPQEADVLPATTTLQHHKVSSRSPGFMDEALRRQASLRSGSFHGRQGLYIRRQSLPPPTSSSSAADSRSRPQSPSSEVSLSDPAGRCHFQTNLFVVVEKPAGVASGWARSPDVTAGLQVHAGMPQSDEDINIDQSKEDT
ncbi:cadherin-related family member 5-like isoform X1 [Xiphophorus maculatus]|uniref:cadherin-related family member 5-like isoform X1 n=1 Tax=Xiphophorus maculatus TaxID=8083 RepID=UPI000C6CDCD4|nr:cadherin-related family member 5-like isoform X1 [Xiphophorus maculatus]XP_023205619.1 cadherin-related family member 5-like isoform X1 [Xiphophorus maculatus]XP_023205620.1 cadherin-related family member 5-like isoform X1 [Xiphophorus maculatus]